ncbi:alpha/beta fold hydrolase [Roseobacter sinensis]|uniref:Alpha/beta fold hydrolase n=1 Tax=Roseobacter sinensis TaxID=2931391 RepID=A0ABT3BER1_9RHOB|nr:alpha/beta fold hydrolase [Roseobacter sp. WL0113]MCV3272042.1 alpha/beta fold hydrolase [Roseobacter sp. WL0113]
MDHSLRISLLGELTVTRNGAPVALPASRKARAVLGYLAATARPVRRERLCELFWELPDDPRSALRWALSKLRPAVDSEDSPHIVADRERVAFSGAMEEVDLLAIRARLLDEPPFLPPAELRQMAAELEHPLLDGLAQAGGEYFQLWLAAEREDVLLLRRNVLRRLALHPEIGRPEAVKWARRWKEQTPLEEDAARSLVHALARTGREDEARQHEADFFAAAKAAGLEVSGPLMPETPAPAEPATDQSRPDETLHRRMLRKQQIGFCRSSDGVRIAHASIGDGPPLVKAANWLNHLELDCNSPIWGPTFDAWAADRRFIRYDERGNGLSDWDVKQIGFDAFVRDLETVVDALGLDRFPLLGISQGCAVSIAYAARHPERVSGLILIGGYATGWRIGASAEEQARREAVLTLTRHGWGTSNPAYRHIFSQTFMPDAKPDDLAWFDEFQRRTVSPENAVRFQEAFGTIDVRDDLAKVQVPTIVFHARDDERISLDQGRALAAGIPGADFVELDSKNHILLGHEPAWHTWMTAAKAFLAQHGI